MEWLSRKNLLMLAILELLCLAAVLPATIETFNQTDYAEDDCEEDSIFAHGSESLHRVGNCELDSTLVAIRNDNINPPEVHIIICHNEVSDWTLWTRHDIDGETVGSIPAPKRPCFNKDIFYIQRPLISPEYSYKKKNQYDTVNWLTGRAAEYIDDSPTSVFYLSRGHLSAAADFTRPDQNLASFYFVNAFPQWQVINNNNWGKIEDNIRKRARQLSSEFTIFTGTSKAVTRLKNKAGTLVEIWLGREIGTDNVVSKLPVNALVWKVIHDLNANIAFAVITVNNPHMPYTPAEEICPDVCHYDQVNWVINGILPDRIKNVALGYTYCCTVESLRAVIPYVPNLGNLSPLT